MLKSEQIKAKASLSLFDLSAMRKALDERATAVRETTFLFEKRVRSVALRRHNFDLRDECEF
jgi:hypothetical protein